MSVDFGDDDARPLRPSAELTRLFGAAVRSPSAQPRGPRRRWIRRYAVAAVASDFGLSLAAALVAFGIRFGGASDSTTTWRYAIASVAFPFLFVGAIASYRAYEPRFLASGSEEYRRVFDGAIRLGALVAILAVGFKITPARGYLVVSFPLAIALTLSGRYAGRRILERMRSAGRCFDNVIAVGRERSVAELIRTVHADHRSGFRVVGVCLDTLAPRDATQVEGVPVFGRTTDVLSAIDATGADTVAITAFSDLDTHAVQHPGWQPEGSEAPMLVRKLAAERTAALPVHAFGGCREPYRQRALRSRGPRGGRRPPARGIARSGGDAPCRSAARPAPQPRGRGV